MGGSSSSTAASTDQTDNRRVIGQNGISLEGSTIFQSDSRSLTDGRSWQDNSTLTTTDSRSSTDGRSWQDNSTNTTLDANVANAAIWASNSDLQLALNSTNTTTNNAFDFLKKSNETAYDFGRAITGKAFDFAQSSEDIAQQNMVSTSNLVKNAYADAKGRGALTDKIMIGALVMAGLVAIAALRK